MSDINLEQTVLKITLGDIVQQFSEEELQKEMPVFMQDIDSDTKELVDTYQLYLSEGNFSEAEMYRASHPELETRIWDSFKANSLLAYASYIYMYARNQSQQCVISETQPPEGNGDDIVGQVEGDIWFRIDEIKDGIVNTTPFQKQADGSYMEFAVAPKLEFSNNEDIDEVQDDEVTELTHPESLINNESLKYYTRKYNDKLKGIEDRLEQVFQSASDGKNGIIDAITGLSIEIEDPDNISFEDLADIISSQLLKYAASSYISCSSSDYVCGENSKTISLRQTSNSGTAFTMAGSSILVNHKVTQATIKAGATTDNMLASSGNTHAINGGIRVYCNGEQIGSAGGTSTSFSKSFTTTLNSGDIITASIWCTDNPQVGRTKGPWISITGIV